MSKVSEKQQFRLANKRMHLTYAGHLNANKWLAWANSLKKNLKVEFYSICHELGKEKDYPHTHILVQFTDILSTRNCRFLDYENIHPQIEKVAMKPNDHWENVIDYHKKEDIYLLTNIIEKTEEGTDFLDEEDVPSMMKKNMSKINTKQKQPAWTVADAWKCESISHAIEECNNLSKVGGIIASWGFKKINYGPEPKIKWRIWQFDLDIELKGVVNTRSIIFYIDKLGNAGKSVFAEHYQKFRNAFVATSADTKDIPSAMLAHKQIGGKFDVIIIDFARTTSDNDEFYQSIEEMKSGKVTVKKYNSAIMSLDVKPHIVIFSNNPPRKLYERKTKMVEMDEKNIERIVTKRELVPTLSPDRWDIRTIENNVVVKREFNPMPEEILPEGFYVPGTILPVAEPDEILSGDETDSEEEEETVISSVSSPIRRRKDFGKSRRFTDRRERLAFRSKK